MKVRISITLEIDEKAFEEIYDEKPTKESLTKKAFYDLDTHWRCVGFVRNEFGNLE